MCIRDSFELLLTLRLEFLQTNDKVLFLIKIPGNKFDSHNIWNPLQIPSTGPPELANSFIFSIIGEKLAIAPVLR